MKVKNDFCFLNPKEKQKLTKAKENEKIKWIGVAKKINKNIFMNFLSALNFCHPPDLWVLTNYYDHHLNLVVVIHLFYEYLYAVAISKRLNKKFD